MQCGCSRLDKVKEPPSQWVQVFFTKTAFEFAFHPQNDVVLETYRLKAVLRIHHFVK
jgi:hypothetical protein